MFAIVIGVIFASYLIGFLFTNDVEYAEKEFLRKKHDFKDFISMQQTYDKLNSDEKALNDEVAGIQRKLSAIEDFEKNKDKYNSEIQNLSEQINNLAAQKTALETSLNDIENRLSQD